MPASQFVFDSQVLYRANLIQGLVKIPDFSKSFLILCNALSGGAFSWGKSASLGAVLATELPETNGYSRMSYRYGDYKPITTDATTGLITVTGGHNFANGDMVFLFTSSTLATRLNVATPYYVRDSDTGTGRLRLALTPGGSAIAFTGTSSGGQICRAGTYDTTAKQYTGPIDSSSIQAGATAPGIYYTDVVLLHDSSAWANKQISAIDTATSTFTTTTTHGLTASDLVFFTTDANGTLPTSSTAGVSFANNTIFRVTTPSGATFKLTTLEGAAVVVTGAGSGTLTVRNGAGRLCDNLRVDDDPALGLINIPQNRIEQFTRREFVKA